MLNAVYHGKAGRVNVDGQSKSWRQLYKTYEDLLTSAFFTRFTYLSGEIQQRLLESWLDTTNVDFSDFKGAEFWPDYSLPDEVNGVYVEPDLLLSFGNCDVLVEVKAPRGVIQSLGQWKKEIKGYFEDGKETKTLYFLAIGRIEKVEYEVDAIEEIVRQNVKLEAIKPIEWKPIADHLYRLILTNTLGVQDHRVISDMLKALELYGIQGYEPKWSDFAKLETTLDINVMESWPVSPKKNKEAEK
jgi:hypothetical protein